MTMYYSGLTFAILLLFSSTCGGLESKYYETKCPNIEGAIAKAVTTEETKEPGICAGVIRLFFHDCFVNGCDGSVLLNHTGSEKDSPDNIGLRGFDVIQAAKNAAEKICNKPSPSTAVVSCADVLAYAARDCVKLLGGFTYDVVAGRNDSIVSVADHTKGNLPGATFNFKELVDNFGKKGLSWKDLVALTNAHSIGVAHCKSIEERIDVNKVNGSEINLAYAAKLREKCNSNPIVDQDHVGPPNKLDVQWYRNENKNEVLFFSDWVMRTNTTAQTLMNSYAGISGLPDLSTWKKDFGDAMKKMGDILGGDGEIRKVCFKKN